LKLRVLFGGKLGKAWEKVAVLKRMLSWQKGIAGESRTECCKDGKEVALGNSGTPVTFKRGGMERYCRMKNGEENS